MRFPQTLRSDIALLAAVVLSIGGSASRAAAQVPSRPANRAEGDQAAIAKARADSARYAYTAADVRFMDRMIGHHSQAIVMSRMAPTHGASPAVRRLADRIINAQQDEIGTMQQWLHDRRQPVPTVSTSGAPMSHGSMHGSMHDSMPGMAMPDMAMSGMQMPGMLTAAQMTQLDRARGTEFDRLFLTFMIQHHRGAVGMVDTLFGTYGAGQDETVFKFASDVHVDQTTEIARMQQMLADVVLGAP